MKNCSCLIVLLSAATLFVKTAPAHSVVPAAQSREMKPFVMPFSRPVLAAFGLPTPNSAAIETPAGDGERQFAVVSFVNRDLYVIDTVPLDDFKGGTLSVLGSVEGTKLLLLVPSGISVLDLNMKIVTAEYASVLPRADLTPQYFQAAVTNYSPLTVIAEIRPSIDAEGMVDPTQHSLVFDEVIRKKNNGRIPLTHPLKQFPPVFFNSDVIIYRNSRNNISEPWKALDKSFKAIQHPLCAVLDSAFTRSTVLGLALSGQYQCAIVYSVNGAPPQPIFTYISLKTHQIFPVALPGGNLVGQKNFVLSPSGRWVCFTAYFDNNGRRFMNHFVLDLQSGAGLVPSILAAASKSDCAVWMSEPEALAIFSAGKVSVWDMPKNEIIKTNAKPKKEVTRYGRYK
jgi:hypothetical protein